jgi:hypothetical protein
VGISVGAVQFRLNRDRGWIDRLTKMGHDSGSHIACDLVRGRALARHDPDVIDSAIAVADACVSDTDEGADE